MDGKRYWMGKGGVKMANEKKTDEKKPVPADLRLYSITDLEEILGVNHRVIWRYIKDGELHGFKLGNRWRITEQNLREFIQNQEAK